MSNTTIRESKDRFPTFDDDALALTRSPRVPSALIRETRRIVEFSRRFADEVATPLALDLERRTFEEPDLVSWDLVKTCNEWGLYTMFVPKLFGGSGASLSALAHFNEEIGVACLGISNVISVHNLGVACLAVSGNTRLARRVLDEVKEGERTGEPCLISVSVTEPGAGTDLQELELSDRAAITTRAVKVDGGYIVNGTKVFTSSGHFATWDVLYTCTDPKHPAETMVVLIIRRGTKGFSLGKHEDKLGQRVCPASTLMFDNCFVPDDQVLMDQHTIAEFTDDPVRDVMVRHFDFWLCLSRAAIAAWGVAAARGAYEIALDYANKNELDGKPMIRHEWVQCRLTEMYANVRVGRLTYLDALAANPLYALLESKPVYYAMKFTPRAVFRRVLGPLLDRRATTRLTSKVLLGRRFDQSLCVGLSSMAKFTASELGAKNCQLALELMGVAGTRHDRRVEKILRDVKVLQIYEGTTQLNRLDTFKTLIAPLAPDSHPFED